MAGMPDSRMLRPSRVARANAAAASERGYTGRRVRGRVEDHGPELRHRHGRRARRLRVVGAVDARPERRRPRRGRREAHRRAGRTLSSCRACGRRQNEIMSVTRRAVSPPGAGPRPGTTQCNISPRKHTARFGATGTRAAASRQRISTSPEHCVVTSVGPPSRASDR